MGVLNRTRAIKGILDFENYWGILSSIARRILYSVKGRRL